VPKTFSSHIELRQLGATSSIWDITNNVRKLEFTESVLVGYPVWHLELEALRPTEFEPLAFGRTPHELRITLQKDSVETTTDWKQILVESATLEYFGKTPIWSLSGTNKAINLNQKLMWKVYQDTDAMAVLKEVANRSGLKLLSQPLKSVGTWHQLGQTDLDFLRMFTSEVAQTAGQRDISFYVENENLNIWSVDQSKKPIKSFGFGTGDDRVESIQFSSNGRKIEQAGGSLLTTVGFDIKNKRSMAVTPGDALLPGLAKKLYAPHGEATRILRIPEQRSDRVNEIGATQWMDPASRYFSFQAVLAGDVTLKLFDIVDILAMAQEGDTTTLNGKYPVCEIMYFYESKSMEHDGPSSLTTYIGGFRRHYHYGPYTSAGKDFSAIRSNDSYDPSAPDTANQSWKKQSKDLG
jgi:hypothetical protein